MNRRPRVAFVIPYLGQWPVWSPLFFESAAANSGADFLLFCETKPDFPLPHNVAVVQTSKAELQDRLARTTGLQIGEISGHKLCDFRPYFGLCFADYLKKYEFWGFCDIDLMFGDLARILEPQFLDQLDVFTAHDTQIAGHFTILRNIDLVNRIGFEIEDWPAKCMNPQTTLMEELLFSRALEAHSEIRWGRPASLPVELKRPFCRFGITFGFAGEVAHLGPQLPALVEWQNGRVFYSDTAGSTSEVLYVHFMGLKHWWHWLSFGSGRGSQSSHRFSRIGYGGPTKVVRLGRFPWKQVYEVQSLLQSAKTLLGRFSRTLLPHRAFLRLRRLVFGKGRY